MVSKNLLLLITLFFPFVLYSQSQSPVVRVNFSTGDRYAYIDSVNRTVNVLKYTGLDDFHCGLARVSDGEKIGYIDKYGNEVIPLKYTSTRNFDNDVAIVGYDKVDDKRDAIFITKKRGIIDREGKPIFPIDDTHAEIADFSEGLACVSKSTGGLLVTRSYYIDNKGNKIITLGDGVFGKSFSNGMAVVNDGPNYGFIDRKGNVAIPLIYEGAESFSNGLAAVLLNDKWGYIDDKGKEVIPFVYEEAYDFKSDGFAVVVNRYSKCGLIDPTGKIIVPLECEKIIRLNDNLLKLNFYRNSKLAKMNGELVSPKEYTFIDRFSEGRALVRITDNTSETGSAYGFIDESGVEVIPPKYSKVWAFSDGLARFQDEDKYGFIDKEGVEVIEATYSYVRSFSNGLAWFQGENGMCGYINTKNEQVIPAKYKGFRNFTNGFAEAYDADGNMLMLDKKGNEYKVTFMK